MKILLSIIFVYYNTPLEIEDSIKSLRTSIKEPIYEIIIVNNNSPRELPNSLKEDKKLILIHNEHNLGYGKALNQGTKVAKGKYLLLLNPDTKFLENSIDLMLEKIRNDHTIGILGPQLLDKSLKVQKVGNSMPFLPDALFAFSFLNKLFPNNFYSKRYFLSDWDRNNETDIPVVCGAVMLISKNLFQKIGGFDERFFMYFEESDLCLRVAKEGYRVVYFPQAKVIHLVGKSSNNKAWIKSTFEQSRYKFFSKYYNKITASLAEGFLRLSSSL